MGRPKALLPCPPDGHTFVSQAVRTLEGRRSCRGSGRWPHGRPGSAKRGAATSHRRCLTSRISTPELGQLSSLLGGVSYAESCGADGVMVLPVDIPSVSPATVQALREAFDRGPEPLMRRRVSGPPRPSGDFRPPGLRRAARGRSLRRRARGAAPRSRRGCASSTSTTPACSATSTSRTTIGACWPSRTDADFHRERAVGYPVVMTSAPRHLSMLRSYTPADALTIGNASLRHDLHLSLPGLHRRRKPATPVDRLHPAAARAGVRRARRLRRAAEPAPAVRCSAPTSIRCPT
jgi:CTP:molybdopterin cytidylyltransferase MocA